MTDLSQSNRAIFSSQADIDGKQDVDWVVDHDSASRLGRCGEATLGSLKPAAASDRYITADNAGPSPSAGKDRSGRRP